MMRFDKDGKNEINLDGRYVIHTTANILWWSDGRRNRFMTKLIHLPVSSNPKCFIIEGFGSLLVNSDVQEFEYEMVGGFKEFDFKQNGE